MLLDHGKDMNVVRVSLNYFISWANTLNMFLYYLSNSLTTSVPNRELMLGNLERRQL